MAYKEKLEQQGRHRSRKFSTHVEVPDRDVLYRAEVSLIFVIVSLLFCFVDCFKLLNQRIRRLRYLRSITRVTQSRGTGKWRAGCSRERSQSTRVQRIAACERGRRKYRAVITHENSGGSFLRRSSSVRQEKIETSSLHCRDFSVMTKNRLKMTKKLRTVCLNTRVFSQHGHLSIALEEFQWLRVVLSSRANCSTFCLKNAGQVEQLLRPRQCSQLHPVVPPARHLRVPPLRDGRLGVAQEREERHPLPARGML